MKSLWIVKLENLTQYSQLSKKRKHIKSVFICADVAITEVPYFTSLSHYTALFFHSPSLTLHCICDTKQTGGFLIYIHMGGKID